MVVWRALIEICLFLVVFPNYGNSQLFPIRPFDDQLETAMFPNERLSLDDCHLRYYKYGKCCTSAPAFGQPAYLREFAHMAAIGWTQPNGTVSWRCGGSLIWNNYVLTAAHCTSDNGSAPDVARFGDINILSDEDDQYAQQLKIVQIIRHPEYRFSTTYNDIALLKLEANVTLHPTVAPACLWKDNDVRFPNLEATGWGDTGFALDRTPSLLKVTLKPVSNGECNQTYGTSHRRLREGVKDHQICAGDEKMDTCPGDSGGPLQIKLLHNGRMSPFLVGITSFGMACGSATPGVYTRVSSFYDWITGTIQEQERNVPNWSVEQVTCALRYASLREFEDDIIQSRSDNYMQLDTTKAHMTSDQGGLNHIVKIGWDDYRINLNRENCTGTLIDDDTVITLAECTSHTGIAASFVDMSRRILEPERIKIAQTFVHPGYKEYSLYNNIAVLKLKNRVKFTNRRAPACIWHSESIPSPQLQVAGRGRFDINELNFGEQFEEVFIPQDEDLLPRASINTVQNCTIPSEFQSRLMRGLAREHLCVGNSLFLVPGSCRLLYGAPMQLPMFRTDRFFYYAYGLNSFGRDCGFGEAAVSTRIFSHIEWLKTVLLPNFRDSTASVQFINPDWQESDACEYDEDEHPGICTHYTKCPKLWQDFKGGKIVHFCSTGSVVCCPTRFVQHSQSRSSTTELDICRTEYATLHPKIDDFYKMERFPHIVTLIGSASSSNGCLASLITKQLVVTSATCISTISSGDPKQALLADGTSIPIENTILHPNYDTSRKVDDIALVKLGQPIRPTAKVFPACVWTNQTHTPFNLRLVEGNLTSPARQVTPMYNADCQRDYHQRRINTDQLCVDEILLDEYSTCYRAGGQLVWPGLDNTESRTVTPYVVGFYSFGEQCQSGNPAVFTRISSYIEWIRENI